MPFDGNAADWERRPERENGNNNWRDPVSAGAVVWLMTGFVFGATLSPSAIGPALEQTAAYGLICWYLERQNKQMPLKNMFKASALALCLTASINATQAVVPLLLSSSADNACKANISSVRTASRFNERNAICSTVPQPR